MNDKKHSVFLCVCSVWTRDKKCVEKDKHCNPLI
jgi:hypothetical protein